MCSFMYNTRSYGYVKPKGREIQKANHMQRLHNK